MVSFWGGVFDAGGEFLKAFRTVSSERISVFFVKKDKTVMANMMGKLAEGGRYLVLPTLERIVLEPVIYRDPLITKRQYAIVYEENIRCIDVSEFGRNMDAIKFGYEAYKIYAAKLMEFLTPSKNVLAIIFLIMGFFAGTFFGIILYWVLF